MQARAIGMQAKACYSGDNLKYAGGAKVMILRREETHECLLWDCNPAGKMIHYAKVFPVLVEITL